jgi:type IV pilus assembly protein PilF
MRARLLKAAAVLVSIWVLEGCASASVETGADLSSDEKAAQANLNLGAAYLREGKPQLAVEKLQRALEQDSRLAEAHSALALAYDQLGQEDDAAKHYRRAAQLAPDDPSVANSYAVFLCRQHRWRDAEPYFKRAADNPRYTTPAAALTNAGTCALSAGKSDSAEAYYRAALEKNDGYADALAGLMRLYYSEQNYLEARAFMQRYLDVRPATAPVLWLCFNLETQLKNPAAAQRCANRLQEDFPTSAEFAQMRRLEGNAKQ